MNVDGAPVLLQAGGDIAAGRRVAGALNGRLLATVHSWPDLQELTRRCKPALVLVHEEIVEGAQMPAGRMVEELRDHDGRLGVILLCRDDRKSALRGYDAFPGVVGAYVHPEEQERMEAEVRSWWQPVKREGESRRPQSEQRPRSETEEVSGTSPGTREWTREKNGHHRPVPHHDARLGAHQHGAFQANGGAQPSIMPRQLVVVASPKGGVGKTFVAVNLAMALHIHTPYQALLLDFDLGSSDTAVHLDLLDGPTVVDLLPHADELRRRGLESFVCRDPHAGLAALPGPDQPQLADLVQEAHVRLLVDQAVREYPFVVVDTASGPVSAMLEPVLEEATVIMLVTTPEATALRQLRQALETFRDGGPHRKLLVVVNGLANDSPVNARGIAGFLEHDVAAIIERAHPDVESSIFNGRPLISHHPDASPVGGLLQAAHAVYPLEHERAEGIAGQLRRWGERLISSFRQPSSGQQAGSGGAPLGF